ncbi:MAG: DNA polymerase III subunit gamma/tau, partial [Geminicoccaceae bacterium]
YIIDEVHMLSEKAFNALLKTLEEPPPQAIFIFATTEIRKVPVTVVSRCQRFDLRRIEGERLGRHLAEIATNERIAIEPAALGLIVRAAEGSVRDGLSLLDQAIALVGADQAVPITAGKIQDMLGLADRSRVLDLFELAMRGNVRGALDGLSELYELGSEPEAVIQDLLEICHWLTRIKVSPEAASTFGVADADRARGRAMAEGLGVAVLARTWQMLLKGLDDLGLAPSPLLAAEMLIVRLAYAAELPPPGELARLVASGAGGPADAGVEPPLGNVSPGPAEVGSGLAESGAPYVAEPADPRSFTEAVALFRRFGEPALHSWLYEAARLVRFEPGRIEVQLAAGAPPDLAGRAAEALGRWTGRPWSVGIAREGACEPTLAEQDAERKRARIDALADDPRVRPILESFPGARIVDVRSSVQRT